MCLLQITIEVGAKIQRDWKLALEANLIKGQPPIITNRFVNLLFLSILFILKFF